MYRRPAYAYRRGCDEFTLLVRAAGARNANREYVPGAETAHDLKGQTAPLPQGEALKVLPEGERTAGARRFWFIPPPGVSVGTGTPGDSGTPAARIRYEGTVYRAAIVDDWGSYTQVTGVLDPEGHPHD